jgi:hypothetical protein
MAANSNQYTISSTSRTKLNSFRFQNEEEIPGNATLKEGSKTVHGNKENQSSWLNGVVDPMQTSPEKSNPQPQGVSAVPAKESKPVKECPQTPANRIPLADLISNAEDSFDPAPGPEITPVEHVIWEHIPASSNPDNSSQTPANRRRKRRHGSSSPGTPSNGTSKKQKEPLDLQSIQALLKTPQHDLAAELWNNYMDKNMVEGSEDLPPPRLANILSSSPQTPASGRISRDSSGLRRSISCAAEWPTSRGKRRRVNRHDPGSGRGIFSRTSSNVLDSGKTKSSRINFLLEKIEKSLQPAQPAEMGPPGSSPLRQRVDARRCRSSSPITDRKGLGDTEAAKEAILGPPGSNAENPGAAALQDSSSEFGDDDLDQDFMDLADASADPFVELASNRNEFESLGSSGWSTLAAEKPAEKPQSNHPKQLHAIDNKPPTVHNFMNNDPKPDDSDDYEDDYGDFTDDFQDILSKCDGNPGQVPPVKTSATDPQAVKRSDIATLPSVAEEDFSGDEFDDDFDMDAIEQTMKQVGENEAHVCRS